MNTVAIDFGTERTKLSYWDERRGEPRLMRLGLDERPYLPSLFYLGQDGTKLLGVDAQDMLEDDPSGIVDVLKRRLRDSSIRRNRQKVTPSELLSLLLGTLRTRAGEELVSGTGKAVDAAVLTVPARYGPADSQITRSAALSAGFKDVELVPEPVAAARAWLHEVGGEDENMVVFDCGGGTIDWAFLRRIEGNFRLDPDCPPGGDEKVGGHDIDEELFLLVKERLEDNDLHDALSTFDGEKPKYVAKLRQLKERYHRRGGAQTLRIGQQKIELTSEHFAEVANQRFVKQAWQGLEAYLQKVESSLDGRRPKILLVGGSARLQGLRDTIAEHSGCEVVWWERSEYATALGAVLRAHSEPETIVSPRPVPLGENSPKEEAVVPLQQAASDRSDLLQKFSKEHSAELAACNIAAGGEIPPDKIVAAWSAYARAIPVSDVILFHDATIFGSGKKGLLASVDHLCISATSDNKPWDASWHAVRWLCLWPSIIGFDDVLYTLAGDKSETLYRALDTIHAAHRTSDFYANDLLMREFCKALLGVQFLPITEPFGTAAFGPMTMTEGAAPAFAQDSSRLLRAAVDTWISRDTAASFLDCIAHGQEQICEKLAQLSDRYAAMLKNWRRIRSSHEEKSDQYTGLKKGVAAVGGILGSFLVQNPLPAVSAGYYVFGGEKEDVADPMKRDWKDWCRVVAESSRLFMSIIEQQVIEVERLPGGYSSLFQGVDHDELYRFLATPIGSKPLVRITDSLELLRALSDDFCDPDEVQVVNYKEIMKSLLNRFGNAWHSTSSQGTPEDRGRARESGSVTGAVDGSQTKAQLLDSMTKAQLGDLAEAVGVSFSNSRITKSEMIDRLLSRRSLTKARLVEFLSA